MTKASDVGGLAGKVLLDNEFLRLEELADRRVIVIRRKAARAPARSPGEIFEEVWALDASAYKDWGLLIDVRQVSGRNDPAFERAMRPVRARAGSRFARVAVLVRSIAGKLQIDRMSRHDGTSTPATTDEDEALAIAQGLR